MRSLHRNPFCCQRDLQNCTETQFAATGRGESHQNPFRCQHGWGPGCFSGRRAVQCGRVPPRAVWPPSATWPSRSCTARCGRPAFASTLRTRRPLIPSAAEEPLAPRVAGAAGLAGHGRRGRPRAPAPSRRPCTRSRLLPKPSISQRHEFDRGLLQNEPPMEVRPVVAMPLP